ncbi:MAG: hypothetical protein OXM54_01775 [Acidimicrobiaceae bacterium]|nr:hypothetical protein [Acidimicrobiaceae bacterium]
MRAAPSLDGRVFVGVANDPGGDVGSETRFEYHEEADGVVWARYQGGSVISSGGATATIWTSAIRI